MNLTLRVYVRLMRLFGRVECAEEAVRAVRADGRAKLVAISDHTKKASFAVAAGFLLVLQIGGSRNVTKVEEGVVSSVAVNVVDIELRPFTGDVEPSQAMLGMKFAADVNYSVANAIQASSTGTFLDSVARSNESREHAGRLIVVQKFAQARSRQVSHSNLIRVHLDRRWPNGDEPFVRPLKLGQPGDSTTSKDLS